MRWLSAVAHVLVMLAVIVLLALAAALGSLVFVGLGALLARLFGVSLFQGACLAIGSGVAVALMALLFAFNATTGRLARRVDELEDDDWTADEDDEDDDEDGEGDEDGQDEENDRTIDFSSSRESSLETERSKVGRNEPCPCGSGKKFKKCCGSIV